MLPNTPIYLHVFFILTTLLTIFIFYRAVNNSRSFLLIICGWLVLQAILGLSGFYTITNAMPPRFVFFVLPMLAFIIYMCFSKKGAIYFEDADIKLLTIIHIVRIPVELILHQLYLHKSLPQVMTYEGRNFDIIAGMTAPIIYYLAFIKKNMGRNGLLIWNFACLGLLLNVVVHAVLAAPFPFQQIGFEQPNIAVLYFPYVWLPFGIVALVLTSHLVMINKLIKM